MIIIINNKNNNNSNVAIVFVLNFNFQIPQFREKTYRNVHRLLVHFYALLDNEAKKVKGLCTYYFPCFAWQFILKPHSKKKQKDISHTTFFSLRGSSYRNNEAQKTKGMPQWSLCFQCWSLKQMVTDAWAGVKRWELHNILLGFVSKTFY